MERMESETKRDKALAEDVVAVEKKGPSATTSGWSLKDKITVSISILSLVISLTLAYNNLRRNDNVYIRLVEFSVENKLDPSDPDEAIFWIAMINEGNRTALVTGAEWGVRMHKDVKLENGASAAPCGTEPGKFPLILEQKKVLFVKLRAPLESILDFAGETSEQLADKPKPANRVATRVDLSLKFQAIDSSGEKHSAELPCGWIDVKDNRWTTFHEESEKRSLFGQRGVYVAFPVTENR